MIQPIHWSASKLKELKKQAKAFARKRTMAQKNKNNLMAVKYKLEEEIELREYTNTSIEPIGQLEGIPILPCLKSGFCCTKAPCAYGEWNHNKSACLYLAPPNDIGQRDCLKYQWIVENVPNYEFYPAFGAGCSSTLFNKLRENVMKNLKDL